MSNPDSEHNVEAAFADGRLSLIIDDPRPYGNRSSAFVGANGVGPDARIVFVHVMSKPAGGEIAGYVLTEDGALRARLPWYSGPWPAMDAAVLARVPGAREVKPATEVKPGVPFTSEVK